MSPMSAYQEMMNNRSRARVEASIAKDKAWWRSVGRVILMADTWRVSHGVMTYKVVGIQLPSCKYVTVVTRRGYLCDAKLITCTENMVRDFRVMAREWRRKKYPEEKNTDVLFFQIGILEPCPYEGEGKPIS